MAFTPKRLIQEINVVPYIDVMLVLLVIFMATAPAINQGVEVTLPKSQTKTLALKNTVPVVITVSQNSDIYLSISQVPDKPVEPQTLVAEVIGAREINPTRMVVLRADEGVAYSQVVNVLAMLQSCNVENVSLETDGTDA